MGWVMGGKGNGISWALPQGEESASKGPAQKPEGQSYGHFLYHVMIKECVFWGEGLFINLFVCVCLT